MPQRIMYIPLDERPVNVVYPKMILDISDVEVLLPPVNIMGMKKKNADISLLSNWMEANISDIDYLVLSIDMFIYGGLIPSRIHNRPYIQCINNLNLLKKFKNINDKLKIYAFDTIMRVPSYNSDDEEPDYYELYGEKIFELGALMDKISQNISSNEEKQQQEIIKEEIPSDAMQDYIKRRELNNKITKAVINYVEEDIIDFLIIPMDDCSEFGFSSKERRNIMSIIRQKGLLHKIYSYPGADEVGCTLVTRAFNKIIKYQPRLYIRYSSVVGPTLIPRLEDRSVHETVKYQIIAAGGIVVDNSLECDFVLMVNPPSYNTLRLYDGNDSIFKRIELNDPYRNINEFVLAVKYYIEKDIPCAVADVAQVNDVDDDMMMLLKSYHLLDKLLSYAGWNTSSNTLGTVIAHSMVTSYYIVNNKLYDSNEIKSKKFLCQRYLEDWAYQHYVRKDIIDMLEDMQISYFNLEDKLDYVCDTIKDKLYDFQNKNLMGLKFDFDVNIPWNRLYEIGITFK
ncbi:hypothetical protein SH1V18_24330 [Vallitalea longa]|uniref:DUF4127 family protein n=1 Tax=Vallitalea longa TaxID=2936439 RepID=A0A9W5YEX5_9FIRM|nr:DUF4127 family protein [Vallitalea longa]GKX29953.1 hypothetical protein SH1V18_24330 [Vallitalea longa]